MKRINIKDKVSQKILELEATLGKMWVKEGSSSTPEITAQSSFGYFMKCSLRWG